MEIECLRSQTHGTAAKTVESARPALRSELQRGLIERTSEVYGNTEAELSSTRATEILLQIVSNWGSEERVGLTEVQIFNAYKQVIPVKPCDIKIIGARDVQGEIENLMNGKIKTVKEKFMWSCSFKNKQPVTLKFSVRLPNEADVEKHLPSWLCIWNYNKSIKDLDIGAKDVRIYVDSYLVYEGSVEQGCGNQVFEYGQFIWLNKNRKPDSVTGAGGTTASGNTSQRGKTKATPLQSPDSDQLSPIVLADHSPRRALSTLTLDDGPKSARSLDCSPVHVAPDAARGWRSKPTSSHGPMGDEDAIASTGRRPQWFEEYRLTTGGESRARAWPESTVSDDRFSVVARSESRVGSGRRSNKNAGSTTASSSVKLIGGEDRRFDTADENRRVSARQLGDCGDLNAVSESRDLFLSQDNTDDEVDDDDGSSLDDDAEINPSLRSAQSSARYGRRAASATPTTGNSERRRLDEQSLEECWSSLNEFNQSQKGRLNSNVEGDVLDMYLVQNSRYKKSTGETSASGGGGGPSLVAMERTDVASDDPQPVDFVIPELPEGRHLVINIQTTWGDRHYVGLNGVELFGAGGRRVAVRRIWAEPADINVLPEYSRDPRVVANLINGVYRTNDDVNLWLAPFTPGADHLVHLEFEAGEQQRLAMIRVWNYNKSRIHSYRGARDCEMTLDGRLVFRGEIARACGGIPGELEAYGDTILFTLDDEILERIAAHDDNLLFLTSTADEEPDGVTDDRIDTRPETAEHDYQQRPFTSAAHLSDLHLESSAEIVSREDFTDAIEGRTLQLDFLCNWGDSSCIGLTGLEVLGADGEALTITADMMAVNRDEATTDKLECLVDGHNVTTDVARMFAERIPSSGELLSLSVHFEETIALSGLRLWNYNAGLDESYCGLKCLGVRVDQWMVSPPSGFLVRRAPGNCHFDFSQHVSFGLSTRPDPDRLEGDFQGGGAALSRLSTYEEYEALSLLPRGFVFQLQLLSTWGDAYYVGLNGLELYDAAGRKMTLSEGDVAAYPDSVNVLDGITDDARTPDKLIDDYPDSRDNFHVWLAPVLHGIVNRVYVIFDYPVTVSMIRLWNYSKTPGRGVKDFAILVDDLLVYHGVLKQTPGDPALPVAHTTVAFSADVATSPADKIVARNGQDVQMTNNSQIVYKAKKQENVDQALRPFTSLPMKNYFRT